MKTVKRKALKRSNNGRGASGKRKGTLARHLQIQLGQVSLLHHQASSSSSISKPSLFQNLRENHVSGLVGLESAGDGSVDAGGDVIVDERDCILSQDFFCTPDYITPDNQNTLNSFDYTKENSPCPRSPEKLTTGKSKMLHHYSVAVDPLNTTLFGQQLADITEDIFGEDEEAKQRTIVTEAPKKQNYVSQSAVALRCRVMPPPCISNPYVKDASDMDIDRFGNQRLKCAGLFSAIGGGDGLSRYHADFHEIEQIGAGNFSRVFKALKRIDGCMYAVKQSTRHLHQETERRKALMEVQALAALGSHQNVVGYYSSWLEDEKLYIQMELCDSSLSINIASKLFTEGKALEALHQIAKALQFIHERGIAHLDVKPENIYVKNGAHKLGDFGCATLLDKSLPVEEGDARYMPQEILNDNYDNLDKVDIFSLGASIFELVRGSRLPESGPHFSKLKEGILPLIPGYSMQFQNLLKAMVDRDPVRRPSAKDIVDNPIFNRIQKNVDNPIFNRIQKNGRTSLKP